MRKLVIGVAGGPSSGKSSVCDIIINKLDDDMRNNIAYVNQESFYKKLTQSEQIMAATGDFNFDHPNAIDFKKLESTITNLLHGKPVKIPSYDMKKRQLTDNVVAVNPVDIVLVEGTLLLFSKKIRELLDVKIFVDVDSDVRLSRRVVRDMESYGRHLNQVLSEYVRFVKPSFEDFILPTKKRADIILPRGSENTIAVDLIVQQVKEFISGKSDFKKPKAEVVSDMLHSSLPSPVDEPFQAIIS